MMPDFELVRRTLPKQIAKEIVDVQPMGPIDWKHLEKAFQAMHEYRQKHGIHCCYDHLNSGDETVDVSK